MWLHGQSVLSSFHIMFTFARLTVAHFPMLCAWLNRPHLQKWWRAEEITMDNVSEKYLPRVLQEDDAIPFIALRNGEPVGYCQYYRILSGQTWWPDDPPESSLGIDVFLADANELGRGTGAAMIQAFIEMLRRDVGFSEVRVDPKPDNARAIRCYQKAGFERRNRITTPDGPAVLMIFRTTNPRES